MKIFLVGFMGAGKTTLGRRLAGKLDFKFYDTDLYFEEKFHFSIINFFDLFGERKFREMERDIIRELIEEKYDAVVSTGGGAACFFDNMELMNKNGITIYLKMHPNSLKHRLLQSKRRRPAVKGLNEEEMEKYIHKIMDERNEYYSKAKIIFKGEDCKVNDILVELNKIW